LPYCFGSLFENKLYFFKRARSLGNLCECELIDRNNGFASGARGKSVDHGERADIGRNEQDSLGAWIDRMTERGSARNPTFFCLFALSRQTEVRG
jgi:hypothetical protein